MRAACRLRPPALAGLLLSLALTGGPAAAGPLETLIGEALRAHPAVQAARARAGAADEAEATARWQFFPTPYISAQTLGAGSSSYYDGDSAVTTVGLSQPLWTGGRLTAGLERARAGVDQAAAGAAQTRQQLAVRFVQAYGDWFAATSKRQAYEKGRVLHERLLAQVIRRVEQGLSAPSDRVLADSRLNSLLADLAAAETQEHIGLARLSQLLGRPLAGDELRVPAAPLPVRAPLSDLLDQARKQDPGLAQYRAEARVQRAVIDERRAEQWPEITLRLERQHGNLTTAGVSPGTAVFVTFTSRLGAGLSTLSAVDEARSRHAAAEADVDAQEREIAEQILADHALFGRAEARRQALRATIAASEAVLHSWDRQFLAGRKSWQDLMNSARELIQIEAQLADVDAAQLVASWRLALLTGGVDATLAAAGVPAAVVTPAPLSAVSTLPALP